MVERIVIAGAGQAGAELCAELRARGHNGPVTLIGDEPARPYQRPPLSKKYLLGEMDAERLELRPRGFYEENAIELVLGASAVEIDRSSRVVALSDGRRVPYDALALTTGARPRALPASIGGALEGVHPVRALADVDVMAQRFAAGARVAIIGGGYIGLEAAAVAASRGLRVELIEAAPRILGRVAAAETAEFFRALHERNGVRVREGAALARFEGRDGRVVAAIMGDGERIPVDFAIVGVGVSPNSEIAEAAGLEVENGVAVDAGCRTSDQRIFAAGDCASFPWRGRRIRLESVQNAIDQARAAARAMLGEVVVYDPVPWFWSDQYDVKLQIAGLNEGYDRTTSRPGARPGAQSVWYYRADALLAVDAMNDPRAYMIGKRWLEAGVSPPFEAVADPATDLKTLA